MALPVTISLNMALKMKAMAQAVAEEQVERPNRRRLIYLDPGKSLNCPPGHVAHGRGTARRSHVSRSRVEQLYRILLTQLSAVRSLAVAQHHAQRRCCPAEALTRVLATTSVGE